MLANQSRLRSLKRKGLTSPKVAPTATALPSLPSSLKKPKYSPSPTNTTTNTLNSPDTMTNRSHSLSHSYALSNPDSSFGEVRSFVDHSDCSSLNYSATVIAFFF